MVLQKKSLMHCMQSWSPPYLHCKGFAYGELGKGVKACCAQAGRSQEAKPWAQRSVRTILLTGTPATSRPKELYTLVCSRRLQHLTSRYENTGT